eukprot:5094382-Alexandrium_andersonii.AAC.1
MAAPAGDGAGGASDVGWLLSSGGGSDDSGARLPGAKGAAAREAFREEVRRRPLGVAQTVYNHMAQSLAAEPIGAGSAPPLRMR